MNALEEVMDPFEGVDPWVFWGFMRIVEKEVEEGEVNVGEDSDQPKRKAGD